MAEVRNLLSPPTWLKFALLNGRNAPVICVNRYYGWYDGPGDLTAAERNLEDELRAWVRYGKPIVVTEFGADALPGLHAAPGRLVRGLPGGADRRVAAGVPADPTGHR